MKNNHPYASPEVSEEQKTYRICMVFDQASGKSRVFKKIVKNRAVDPAQLLPGTWAVRFSDQQRVQVNQQEILRTGINPSPLILIAQRLFPAYQFTPNFAEVARALKHDGIRPVIQLPCGAYNFDSEDLTGQFKIVPRYARVVSTQGEPLWPPLNEIS